MEREALNYYKVSGNECFIAKKEKENEAGDYWLEDMCAGGVLFGTKKDWTFEQLPEEVSNTKIWEKMFQEEGIGSAKVLK